MTEFKQAKRKNLEARSSKLDYIKFQLNSVKDELIERTNESTVNNMINTLTEAANQIKAEIKTLPIRHEYHGTFYIRKQYTNYPESIKVVKGCASIREDIITWTVRDKDGNYISGARDIFKDANLSKPIDREEGISIYE